MNEYEVKKEQRQQERAKNEITRKTKKFFRLFLMWLIPVLVLGGFVWFLVKTTPADPNLEGDLNLCVQHTGAGMHIHPHLSISIDGQPQEIPTNIGVSPACMRPIHTHDDSGALHLEFKKARDVKLGEFFQIWEKSFGSDHIFDRYNSGDKKIRLFVNSSENFDFENYIMRDNDKIEIRYE